MCMYRLSGSVTSCYKQPLCIHSQVLRCAGLFLGGWSQGEQGPHHTDLEGGSDPCVWGILRSRAPKLCSKQRDISSGWACTLWIPYLKAWQEEGQSARPMEGCLWPNLSDYTHTHTCVCVSISTKYYFTKFYTANMHLDLPTYSPFILFFLSFCISNLPSCLIFLVP